MAVKEVAVTGTVIAGSAGGVGYVAYKNFSGETIEDLLDSEVSEGQKGKPITKLGNDEQTQWWEKAWNRYFLEIENSEEIVGAGSKAERDKGDTSKQDKFKTGCIGLLKSIGVKEDENYKKAKKWCVTFETLRDKLDDSKKKVKGDNDSGWNGKYDTAVADTGFKFKDLVKAFNGSSSETTNKNKALHKWCKMAINMSAEKNDVKTKLETYCVLEANGS